MLLVGGSGEGRWLSGGGGGEVGGGDGPGGTWLLVRCCGISLQDRPGSHPEDRERIPGDPCSGRGLAGDPVCGDLGSFRPGPSAGREVAVILGRVVLFVSPLVVFFRLAPRQSRPSFSQRFLLPKLPGNVRVRISCRRVCEVGMGSSRAGTTAEALRAHRRPGRETLRVNRPPRRRACGRPRPVDLAWSARLLAGGTSRRRMFGQGRLQRTGKRVQAAVGATGTVAASVPSVFFGRPLGGLPGDCGAGTVNKPANSSAPLQHR